MATRRPAKARELNYSDVGKAGRRTGITLKEGKLDEHGMEEIDGMFSSPEKSPEKVNGSRFANDNFMSSEEMETGGSSSIPDPADILSARRGGRSAYLPPPRSRSPIKTLMSGSPRRTPGIRSSPLPQSDQFSSPTSAHVAAKRSLNYQTHAGRSPLKQARSFSIPPIQEEAEERRDEHEVTEMVGNTEDFSDDGGSHLDYDAEEENESAESHGDYHEGGQDDNPGPESEVEENDSVREPSPPIVPKTSNRGQKRKTVVSNPEKDRAVSQQTDDDERPAPPAKRRGRKPKGQQSEANVEDQNPRPAKKAKKTGAKAPATNLQMTEQQENDLNQVVENITKRDGPLKNRSLYILKREAPDQNTQHTRSGRVSVRPLAYWRNEKCVFGNDEAEVGQRFPVSTIKEIIRTEEPEPTYTKSGKRTTKKKSKQKAKKRSAASDDDSDNNPEPWETQGGGIFYGPVKIWDPARQAGTQEEEMMDVAYAPSAIQTHEVKDSTFRFAKILSTPFLGSGFVEMPPGAVKKQKNSKRMHMVFFVHFGKISVDISGLQFGAGKGCVFQVPRGNNYSFSNEQDKTATIFFTQGCIPLDPEGNVDTSVAAPPLPDIPIEDRQPTPAAQKPGRKRGRPKQKAQAEG